MEKDIWTVIHHIESVTKRDDLHNLSKDELCRLVDDVYEMLNGIVM